MNPKSQIYMIDSSTLTRWIEIDDVCIYDVREIVEFSIARIPGATLLPLSVFNPNDVLLLPNKKLVFHCKSGIRCGHAAAIMQASGFQHPIYRLEGGIIAWESNGGEIESNDY